MLFSAEADDHELQKSFTSQKKAGGKKNYYSEGKQLYEFFYNLIPIVTVIDHLKINSLLFISCYSLRPALVLCFFFFLYFSSIILLP